MSARYIGGLVYNPPGGWSGSFNGSSQYLTLPSGSAFAFGTGDFTVECFVYINSFPSNPNSVYFVDARNSGQTGTWAFLTSADGTDSTRLDWYTGSGVISGVKLTGSTWLHLVYTRASSTYGMFVNGVRVATGTDSTNYSTSPTISYIASRFSANNILNGYMSNLRVVKGSSVYSPSSTTLSVPTGALLPITNTVLLTCRYPTFVDGSASPITLTNVGTATTNTANPFPTSVLPNPALGNAGNGIYTMSQYASLLGAGTWPAIDPYYENVTFNLHGNAGAVLPFNTDASTNNFQVTQVGDTRPSNYTPFIADGYWSNLFGTSNYLTIPNSTATDPGTGDFCVEAWVYHTASASTLDVYFAVYSGGVSFYRNASGKLEVAQDAVAALLTGATTVPINQWNHVAVTRSGTTLRLFLNGVQDASTTNSTNLVGGVGYIGGAFGPTFYLIGYLSNLRMVKGSAVYTSGFTPPTTPLTAISGTQLLTCQSNRFIDNSSNAFAITVNGAPSVNPLQPFTAPTGTSAYGSGYFDGTGDRLSSAYNSAFILTADFSIEMFVYPVAHGSYGGLISFATPTNPWTGWYLIFYSTTNQVLVGLNNTDVYTSTASLTLNAWNHVVLCRSGSTVALFINGVRDGTVTNSGSFDSGGFPLYIGVERQLNAYTTGYFSDVRVVKGSTPYSPSSSTITVPTSPLTAVSGTSLLTVQTNAPSQNNTFLDSSTNNFPITRNGNTTQGAFTPYGPNWSNYFNGSSTYLSFASNAALAVSSSANYTVEAWVNFATITQGGFFQTTSSTVSNSGALWFGYYSGNLTVAQHGSATYNVAYAWTPVAGVWYHVAATRTSGTVRLFINGTLVKTDSSTQNGIAFTQSGAAIGLITTPAYLTGYLSNVRFVNGSSLYTAAFTPSTAPLTAVTNTVVLSCQSNRFIDNSTNNFTITANGSPSVQRFSPFSPTSAYTTSVIGGSCYFDGNGDSMTVGTAANCASGGAFAMGANFTVEFWFYPLSTSEQTLVENFTGGGGPGWTIYRKSGGQIEIYNGTSPFSGSVVLLTNTWYHIAFVRTGSTNAKTYINGVADMSTTSFGSGEYYQSTYPLYVGQRNPGDGRNFYTTGYFSDVRITKSAVYSANFTPPTAPIAPIANTSAMLSYTNSAIFDNAMMNDLETVGNAQISTSVKKYGSASMYFDGSGDWLFTPTTPNMVIPASSTFTMECWAYLTGAQNTFRMLVSEANGSSSRYLSINSAGIEAQFGGSSGTSVAANYTFTLNTWYHIALVRNGTTVAIYINGQAQSVSNATQTNAFFDVGTGMYIGRWGGSPSYEWPGYIDDLRITKGVARYTANFTPPTSQVQDQ